MGKFNEDSKLALADIHTKIQWASFNLNLGEQIQCLIGAVYHPSNFFLNPLKSWNSLEEAQKVLHKFYKEGPKTHGFQQKPAMRDPYYKPDPETLTRGLYVAVYHKREWHRGLILRKHKRQDKYMIMMIDYGDHEYHPISNIRYIPVKFLENLPAQAIQCKLQFGKELDAIHIRDIYWTTKECNVFFNALKSYSLQVDFIRCDLKSFPSPIIWYVRLVKFKINEQTKLAEYTPEPVDKELIRLLDQAYQKQMRKEKRKEAKAKLSSSKWSWSSEDKHDKPLKKELLADFPGQKKSNTWSTLNYQIDPLYSTESTLPSDVINTSVRKFQGLTLATNAD